MDSNELYRSRAFGMGKVISDFATTTTLHKFGVEMFKIQH